MRVLYLFAGKHRQTSLSSSLQKFAFEFQVAVVVDEYDIEESLNHDLTDSKLQSDIRAKVRAGWYHVVVTTPPCSTFSRVRSANLKGPPPVRSRDHLWGFPWLFGKHKQEVTVGNTLVIFSVEILEEVKNRPFSSDNILVRIFMEHPEDLGGAYRPEDRTWMVPASIWQWDRLRNLVDLNNSITQNFTTVFHQCCWGVPWRKPTRIVSNVPHLKLWGFNGWPQFGSFFTYIGPLQVACDCAITHSLAKTSNNEAFRTTGTSQYPQAMDEALALAVMDTFKADYTSQFLAAGTTAQLQSPFDTEGSAEGSAEEKCSKKARLEDGRESTQEKTSEPKLPVESDSAEVARPHVGSPGWGKPLQAYYKGLHRGIHDGGGLCSPGRWAVVKGEGALVLASEVRKLFLAWMARVEMDKKGGAEDVFWRLSAGLCKDSPFSSTMEEHRSRLDKCLSSLGLDPTRRRGDRDTEINFRRLRAILQILEDEDFDYLDQVASEGVILGADEELPRVVKVFEEKTKWAREFTDELMEDRMADNYQSAEESWADIVRQVDEEVVRGTIVEMDESVAREEFKGRLAVAALGAVPKEQGSSTVRLIHDGSFSVDVNRRIRVRDRLRFPLIDDAAAILLEAERCSKCQDGPQRFSLVYDISRAHKLIPVVKRDWGLQAFRLPGDQRPGKIFVHTRGTFGIASAAYWWGRVASGVVRAAHKLGGQALGLLHLLFADDGWLVATGRSYWKKILFWLFVLELMEVPLSWKKVKGGTQVQWIGYQLCVETFRKGISEKKVRWVKDWVLRHLQSGGATGREMKSALGRLTFVAGALQMLRPFLGPMFSWAAVLKGGAFSKFPEAVHILLKFVVKCVSDEPMTLARSIPMATEDVFRVDAKAEKDKIVLGGWESFGGVSCSQARWFSVELTRQSAPWAYIKGEPFRAIAALELSAILVALMLFGKDAEWAGRRSRMLISAFTDNMGNSFLVSKFLSCKYPLSIVLMEEACQLRKLNVEMDLGWIPRNENEEADSLTNAEFGEFDARKRITATFDELDFIVLKELVEEAGKLDEDINLAKSSKEAKELKLKRGRSPKAKRGEIRWKDPW